MQIDRRSFLLTTGAVAGAAVLSHDVFAGPLTRTPLPYDDPAYLQGDPFDACVHDRGFGTSSWSEARAAAMRHRADPMAHHLEELRNA